MQFEWDPAKAASNLKKHGISFEVAREVFEDPDAVEAYDKEHSQTEARFILIGIGANQVVVVIHTTRHHNVYRIISARPASRIERRLYYEKD